MSQASKSSACGDGADIELGASLLLGSSKYSRIWRRSLYVGIFISVKKAKTTSSFHESPTPSPISAVPYTPLPLSAPPARTSSAKSSVAIDIDSNSEEKKQVAIAEERIKNEIGRIVKEKDLKSLDELGGVDRVYSVLASQRPHKEGGTNDTGNHGLLESTVAVHGTSFSNFLLNHCKRNRFTIIMLLISAMLSFATEFKQEGPRYGWHDGVVIVFAVILLVALPPMANFWRERIMLKLSKRKDRLEALVVGDCVRLRAGDDVPADGLLVSGDIFVLAATTKSKCHRETNPFLMAGSKVIKGQGRMLVTSVGNKMNLAQMQNSVTCIPERVGLLESQIERPISYVENFALFISLLVALVVFIRLICKKGGDDNEFPEIKGNISIGLLVESLQRIFFRPQGKVSILTSLITFAILCMQHAMPLMVILSLKYQSDKLESNQDADINDLSACTTMGLATVICIDASGGLISQQMEVSKIWIGEKDISNVEESETGLVVHDVLQQGVGLAVLKPEFSIFPMSNSLKSWAETRWGMNMESFHEDFDILQHGKLNSDKEGSRILVRKIKGNEQVLHLHCCGAASAILEMCSQYYDSHGECRAMKNQKIIFGQLIKDMEESGLKTIAFAYRQTHVQELDQQGLILLGLIGLKNNFQELTKSVLEDLKNNGIKIKLVSDDDIMVVSAIACDLGIENGVVLEGKELQDINGTARLDKVDLALVMASFSPEDKLLMVECLQEKGHVVAFLGRLTTSHTSVLKVADVGIVDNCLSPIAELDSESSDISVKCFSALTPIVKAGRCEYHNIQKFIQLQLTSSISGSLITLITTMSSGESPLTTSQLIWVNMLMCLLGLPMMMMELNSEGQLANQSSGRNQSIITKKIWTNIFIQVLYQVSASMIFQFGGLFNDSTERVGKTMIFNTFLLCLIFNQLNTMHALKKGVFMSVLQNYRFLVALAVCFLMQVLVIEYAKGLANCVRLNATQWAFCVLVGALSWAFHCTLKFLPVILSTNCASELVTSCSEFSSRQCWLYLYWGFPFLMLLFFPLQFFI